LEEDENLRRGKQKDKFSNNEPNHDHCQQYYQGSSLPQRLKEKMNKRPGEAKKKVVDCGEMMICDRNKE